jgi:hypothetical protein
MKTTGPTPLWVKTPVANLVRYVPSGIYFARVRVGGKLIRQSLKTDKISVARLRLTDLIKEERENLEARAEATKGRMTFAEALAIYRGQLEGNPAIKATSKLYRRKCDRFCWRLVQRGMCGLSPLPRLRWLPQGGSSEHHMG